MTAQFLTLLSATQLDEFEGTWQLDKALVYLSDRLGKMITVPAGFITDFASVPRILGVYDLEGGKCNKAAVVHDWLYSTQMVDRPTADAVLKEAITASGYPWYDALAFYAAVRAGGASHWAQPNQPQEPQIAMQMAGG